MAKTKKSSPKTKEPPAVAKKNTQPRRLKTPTYKSFRLSKRIKSQTAKLPHAFRLFGRSLMRLKRQWRLFLGIIGSYAILNLLLVRGFGSVVNLASSKAAIQATLQGHFNQFSTGVALFGVLLGSAGTSSSSNGNVYQALLVIVVSLALIWGLRQTLSSRKVTTRETFYQGMYPIIPFILVLLVIGLQLIPLLVGGWLYSTVVSTGLAATTIEKIIWALAFFLLALFSLYMICSSLFALYIVTLPNMTPLKALRSARQLVLYRRWSVLRKVLFLPVALLLLTALIILPIIIFTPNVAEWAFFVVSIGALAVVHSYMYGLYRELL